MRTRLRRFTAALLCCATLAIGAQGHATEPPAPRSFGTPHLRAHPAELGVVLALGVAWPLSYRLQPRQGASARAERWPDAGAPRWNPWAEPIADALGHGAVHHNGRVIPAPTLPMFAIASTILVPGLVYRHASPKRIAGAIGVHAVIAAESTLLAGNLTGFLGAAHGRPRPYLHPTFQDAFPDVDLAFDRNLDLRSAPSGHTAVPTALYLAIATSWAWEHHSRTGSALGFAIGVPIATALGVTPGILRVVQGVHYPTDVLYGFAIGASAGLLIPWLHTLHLPMGEVQVSPTLGGAAVTWQHAW